MILAADCVQILCKSLTPPPLKPGPVRCLRILSAVKFK
jgi:hypothetical protein